MAPSSASSKPPTEIADLAALQVLDRLDRPVGQHDQAVERRRHQRADPDQRQALRRPADGAAAGRRRRYRPCRPPPAWAGRWDRPGRSARPRGPASREEALLAGDDQRPVVGVDEPVQHDGELVGRTGRARPSEAERERQQQARGRWAIRRSPCAIWSEASGCQGTSAPAQRGRRPATSASAMAGQHQEGREHQVDLHARVGVEHQVAEPGAGADPLADHGADRRHGRRDAQARGQGRQGRGHADLAAGWRQRGASMVRASSSQPGSVRRSPSKNAAVTGK